jgi:metal-sulfur cluster biosynthetic enzyme
MMSRTIIDITHLRLIEKGEQELTDKKVIEEAQTILTTSVCSLGEVIEALESAQTK